MILDKDLLMAVLTQGSGEVKEIFAMQETSSRCF